MRVLLCILLFALFISIAFALNATEAYNAILQARKDIAEMEAANFSTQLVKDLLFEAEQIYNAQLALEERGGKPEYYLVIERTRKISKIKETAFLLHDELKALEAKLREVNSTGNFSEAWKIFEQAKKEFYDERYEKVPELIDKTYKKIIELQALSTRVAAIYKATTKSITKILEMWWKEIIATIIVILFFIIVFWRKIKLWRIDRKIKLLELEKSVLRELIKKAQYEYFQLGKIPEVVYRVKVRKFGELIRDINRKIPLLLEEKEKHSGKSKKKSS